MGEEKLQMALTTATELAHFLAHPATYQAIACQDMYVRTYVRRHE